MHFHLRQRPNILSLKLPPVIELDFAAENACRFAQHHAQLRDAAFFVGRNRQAMFLVDEKLMPGAGERSIKGCAGGG